MINILYVIRKTVIIVFPEDSTSCLTYVQYQCENISLNLNANTSPMMLSDLQQSDIVSQTFLMLLHD